ncbi:GAF domain-containing protein [Corynebacterium sp. HMSC078H07]|uniref:helix-turn-helix domain-containing protein n=1 Tax=Corynebacterium sp. HMSC078H07 TaxID=1739379 RepID=UPI0008A28000|nr:GAF domain-containing protein [Corynebacterium sp. HMSC078H07]OFR65120.1 diguanylate cyclase [Corynebacterium sp. HMSC078H07]
MSLLGPVLSHLASGTRVPDELREQLAAEELSALRAVEETMRANHTWRVMSTKLLDVSHMLNAGRDSTDILQAIVRHARSTIGTDVGYLSLNDEDTGFTKVLATSGVVTEEFRTINMPMGSGILGIVAATNRPAWTYDHSADPDVTHVDYVDRAVEAEGIRGILGAPIRIGGKTIGALLVGDRHPRHYTHEEIAALEVLGSITSVALENAQVIESQGESVAELTRSQIALSRHIEELQWLNEVNTHLLHVLMNNASFEELERVLAKSLDAPVTLWTTEDAPETPPASTFPVEFNGRELGTIGVDKELSDTELRVISHASAAFTSIALFAEALVDATARKVDDLVYAVALGNAGREEIARLRHLTGISLTASTQLYFLGLNSEKGLPTRPQLEHLLPGHAAITHHDQHVCVLYQPERAIDKALASLLETYPDLAVSAIGFSGVDSARSAHDSAMAYLDSAIALSLRGQLVTESTLGTVGLILGADPHALELLSTHTIAPLLRYDEENSTELASTAHQYLLSGHSIPQTARIMFIHPNTVRQRLDRIVSLMGEDWAVGQRGLDVFLALRAHSLRG